MILHFHLNMNLENCIRECSFWTKYRVYIIVANNVHPILARFRGSTSARNQLRSKANCVNRCFAALLLCCAATLLRCCFAALLRFSAVALLRCFFAALLLCCPAALLHCCAAASPRCCFATLLVLLRNVAKWLGSS